MKAKSRPWPDLQAGPRAGILAVSAFAAALGWGQAPARGQSDAWLTGPAVQRQLGQALAVSWAGNPLRRALYNLGAQEHVAVLLDRRIDPDQLIDLASGQVPLEKIFLMAAEKCGIGLARLGPVVYFGPRDVARHLRTIDELCREQVRALPAELSRKLFDARPLRWPDLATPRELLTRLAAESGLTLQGAERVPHDLWAAADLPALPLVQRLTLVAVQFDLTFRVWADSQTMTLVALPPDPAITRTHHVGRLARAQAERWATLAPQAKIRVNGSSVEVRGLVEDHERIAAAGAHTGPTAQSATSRGSAATSRSGPDGKMATSAGRPQNSTGPTDAFAEKRFTVKQGKGQLGPLLHKLADQIGLEIRLDEDAIRSAGISLEQPVSFSVTEATLDELLAAVLKPVGLAGHREGAVLRVEPAR